MLGSELEFFLVKETYAEAHAKGYTGLTPSVPYILDYHILATTYDEPLHARDPQRDAGGGDARRDLERRGLAGPAGDELPLRRRAHDGRQPRDLQERRQGDRVPARVRDHVHGQAVRGLDRQLVPHPLVTLPRRGGGIRDRRRRSSAAGSPGRSRARRSSRSSSRRPSTRTRGTRPGAGRRRRSRGGTTTGRAGSASSGTGTRAGWRPGSPAATSTRTSPSRR